MHGAMNVKFRWIRLFRRKTKSGFCACAITFPTMYNTVYTDSRSSGESGAAELGPEPYLAFGEFLG